MDATVRILNWEKYNPRKDIKRPHWFALDNELVERDEFHKFNHGEFKAWIYLLSKASKRQKPEVEVDFDAASRKANIAPADFESAINKLADMQAITVTRTQSVRDPNAHVRNPTATLHNTTEQDTTEQNKTEDLRSSSTVPAKAAPVANRVSKRAPFTPVNETDLARQIPAATKALWLQLYPDDQFLFRETLKAYAWYQNNPMKKPRTMAGWIRALSSWFEKGWRWHVKSIQGVSNGGYSEAQMAEILKESP